MMTAQLLEVFGSDLMVVNVARVSYNKWREQDWDAKLLESDIALINYLARHKHTSPFRHPHLQFRITCPIYVARQLAKHQVGVTINEISGRYVDFSDTYTKVGEWRKQSKSSKQGSDGWLEHQEACNKIQDDIVEACKKAYSELTSLGVAKEQARTILPLNLNTMLIWTGSLQAFIHLCELRLKPDAQKEIRDLVAEMLEEVKATEKFEYSLAAFNL